MSLHSWLQASNVQDDDDQSTQGFDWPDTRSEGGGSVVSAFSQAFSQSDSNVSVSNAGGDGESAYGKSSLRLYVLESQIHWVEGTAFVSTGWFQNILLTNFENDGEWILGNIKHRCSHDDTTDFHENNDGDNLFVCIAFVTLHIWQR